MKINENPYVPYKVKHKGTKVQEKTQLSRKDVHLISEALLMYFLICNESEADDPYRHYHKKVCNIVLEFVHIQILSTLNDRII